MASHCIHHVNDPIEDYYDIQEQIGKGAFAVVHRAINKENEGEYAIKIMEKSVDERQQEIIQIEIDILKRIDSSNVVKLHEIFETEDLWYLVLQLITGGELFEKIVEKASKGVVYSELEASKCIKQILLGLKAIHKAGVVHRDLKPENLLLVGKDSDFSSGIVITDFGLSMIIDEDGLVTGAVGTPHYLAPEILLYLDTEDGYSYEVDMWAVGVILYILLCGFPPFFGDCDDDIYDRIEVGEYTYPEEYWGNISDQAKELIDHLLDLNKETRYTADEALQHPWITENNFDQNLATTISELKKFNARRKWRSTMQGVLAVKKFARASGFAAKLFKAQSSENLLQEASKGKSFGERLLAAAKEAKEKEEQEKNNNN